MRLFLTLLCCALATSFFLLSDGKPSANSETNINTVDTAVEANAVSSEAESMPEREELAEAVAAVEEDATTTDESTVTNSPALEETRTETSGSESTEVAVESEATVEVKSEVVAAQASPEETQLTEPQSGKAAVSADSASPKAATHKQSSTIAVVHDGSPIGLNTFALDHEGNILACVSQSKSSDTGYLQTYSWDGKLLQETELEFAPTGVNQTPDRSIIVAGNGKVARVSSAGKVLTVIDSPHLAGIENLEETVTAEAKKQMDMRLARYRTMVEQVNERIAAIEEKSEEERTSRDELLMKSLPNPVEPR